MIIFPAIDLKEGRCVRLEQGDMARATIFNDDPANQARAFAAQGFGHLHIVDLDGAFAGAPVNIAAVEAAVEASSAFTQLGGGIRDLATIEAWLLWALTGSYWVLLPCATRNLFTRGAARFLAALRSALMRARVSWPLKAGGKQSVGHRACQAI